jgi:glucose/arabinose dehydrogenase
MRLRVAALSLILLLAVLMPTGTAGAAVPGDLTVSNVVNGLDRPWDIAFTPDGTMLFTEKVGHIDARVGGASVVMGSPSDVLVAGEGGLMGLAVDPNFTANRRIYVCMLSRATGRPDDVRVVRFRVASDYHSLSSRTDIITGIDVNTTGSLGRHSGCRPRFGPDGYLWIGTGDAATGTNPQDPDSLAGKVLRVDTDGNGAPGNAGGPFREEIYNYGHRNVQGIAFRPSDGKPYSIEHGTGCDDEVNALVPGGNYGWDPVPGYNESRPMTDLVKFPDAIEAVWSSGCPTIAPSGGTFLSGPRWLGWDDALAIAVLKDSELFIIELDDAGTEVVDTTIRITDRGRLRSAVQGPDGNLYIAQDASPGSILRVVPHAASSCASAPFADVPAHHAFCADIEWVSDQDIADGYPDDTFRPTTVVTRQAMAAFLYRMAGEPPVGPSSPFFADVPAGHPFYAPIQWMAEEELSTGTPDPPGRPLFKPGAAVSRAATAAFLYRFIGSPPFVPPGSPSFKDVSTGDVFFGEIEWLVDEGIAGGYPDGRFGPATAVSRQAMAAFLHRTAELT